jgi:hypothetical protein
MTNPFKEKWADMHKTHDISKDMNSQMMSWLKSNAKNTYSWRELMADFKYEFEEKDILDSIGNEFNVKQECEDIWMNENGKYD